MSYRRTVLLELRQRWRQADRVVLRHLCFSAQHPDDVAEHAAYREALARRRRIAEQIGRIETFKQRIKEFQTGEQARELDCMGPNQLLYRADGLETERLARWVLTRQHANISLEMRPPST